MKQSAFFFIVSFILSALLTACNSNDSASDSDEEPFAETYQSTEDDNSSSGSSVIKIEGKLFSIPSPFQVAMMMKDNEIPYNSALLNPAEKSYQYSTSFEKALNLGIYGANLGYLNIYEQYPEVANYLSAIESLSEELGLSSSFNQEVIERLENNRNNKDSVLFITSNIYKNADAYLFNNERSEIGSLILAGGWLESLYLLTQSATKNQSEDLLASIGEQKYSIESMIALLRPYYGQRSKSYDDFLMALVELAQVFDGVVIKYKYIEPETEAQNKITIINSETKTIISDYQLTTITEKVEKIRATIIN